MELQYVKVENWNNLIANDIVVFKLPKKQIRYAIAKMTIGAFCCNITGGSNSEIFDYLNLDATTFTQNIVGYSCSGIWPKVKSIDDLKKVIKALDDECIKKFGKNNTSKFKVGDEESKIIDIHQAKDGDYISITDNTGIKYIVLFKGIESNLVLRHATYNLFSHKLKFIKTNRSKYWGSLLDISIINYATEEEKQLLDSKLLEAGYKWNNSTKELEAIDSPNTSTNINRPETHFEAELNLFPTKKHYQLNFNY